MRSPHIAGNEVLMPPFEGIGLEMHESPYLRGNSPARLEPGNTFSNEPGSRPFPTATMRR